MYVLAPVLLLATVLSLTAPNGGELPDVQVVVYIGTPCLPARYAQVSLLDLKRYALADSLGLVRLPNVPVGQHQIVIDYPGRPSLTGTFSLSSDTQEMVLIADLVASEIRPAMTSK